MPISETPRTLIYITIVHSQEDMGSLAKRLPRHKHSGRLTEERWIEVTRRVQGLPLDWSGVKLYQDGLPDAGSEMVGKILREVQSPNYELLRWLVGKGAELVGTESPILLREEYNYLFGISAAKSIAEKAKARQAYAQRAQALLAERDAFIAHRIAETLRPSGVGILFIGQAHETAKHLPADVVIRELPGGFTQKN